jgi:transglutaminase-like putative cysteine protease
VNQSHQSRTPPIAAIVALFLAASIVSAAEDFSAGFLDRQRVLETARGLTAEVYPNADTVWVSEHIRDTYAADGTSVMWDDEYIKVLTEKGKRDRRTLSLYYTLPYGTAAFKRVEVIKPDGTVTAVDVARQSRVMVDRTQMKANIYNPNAKILKVAVPGLEVGDVLHLVSTRCTVKARVPNTWSQYRVFEHTSPIKHVSYEVIGPKSLPLRNIRLRDELAGTVRHTREERGETVVYRWEINDVPRMYKEPKMPAMHTVVQRLLISTIPSWQEISRWYWNLCLPHLEETTPGMREKTEALTKDVTTRQEKIQALFTFVSQQIRYMGITTETEAPGYEPHDVRITFENRYGVCRDKAALLAQMLRMAGVPAYPVLIHNGSRKDEEVPQPYFNHAIVAAEDGQGDYILMDPTDESTAQLLPAYLCNQSYLVAHPEGETLRTSPIIPATNNLMIVESTGRLGGDGGLEMQSDLQFDGINDNVYRRYFARIKPEERRRFFEGLVKRRVPGARLTRFKLTPADMQDTSEPLAVNLAYKTRDYLVKGDGYSLLSPPWLGTSVGFVNFVLRETGLEKREYPLLTDVACGVRETLSIELGGAVGKLVVSPDYTPVDTNDVTFTADLSVTNGTLCASGTFLLNTVEFSPSEYLSLKQILKDMEYERRKRPVFASVKGSKAAHDVRILSDDTVIRFEDAGNWTSRRNVRKQILTYGGKKKHSELKLNYNPAWETVRLGTVRVIGEDGTVRQISDEEINVMDAAWVGGAPRYPAAKTMVISLPGVEVGSVTEYEVIYENHAFPFFSMVHSLGSYDPIDGRSFTLSLPRSLTPNVLDLSGGVMAFSQKEQGGRVVYRWEAGAQEAVPREDALPPWWSFNPSVFVSTGTWKPYLNVLHETLLAAASEQPKAAELAGGLMASTDGRELGPVKIRDYVAKNVRLAGPPFIALPLSAITAADVTLGDGYGNRADRAIVLYAMLKAAGFEPEFVLASSTGAYMESLHRPFVTCPQRGLFNAVLVRVKAGEHTIVLNDTDQYAKSGVTAHDKRPGMTMDGECFTLRSLPGMENRLQTEFSLEVADNGDTLIGYERSYHGTSYGKFRREFTEMPPEERSRHFQTLVSKLSQSAVATTDLTTDYASYPGVKRFKAEAPRYAVRSGKYLYLAAPVQVGDLLPLRSDRRTHALYRSAPLKVTSTTRVILPKSTRGLELVPEDFVWQAPSGMGTLRFTTEESRREDGCLVVTLKREADFHSAVVPASQYGDLLEVSRKINHPSMRTIMVSLEE